MYNGAKFFVEWVGKFCDSIFKNRPFWNQVETDRPNV